MTSIKLTTPVIRMPGLAGGERHRRVAPVVSRPVGPALLVTLTSLWIAVLCNLPLWREMHRLGLLGNASGWAFAGAFALMIAASLAALQSLLAWRWSLKPVSMLLLAASALGAYFMLNYGVVIHSTMVINVLQTDAREALDLFNWRLVVVLSLLSGLPIWLVGRTPVHTATWHRQALHNTGMAAVALLLVLGTAVLSFAPLSSAMRNHKHLRYLVNPLNTLYALGHVAIKPLRTARTLVEPIGTNAVLGNTDSKPPLLVLVLGETARSGNFSANGYARDTNPELTREQIASFRNVWSCGTSTAASLPCMFSHLGRDGFDGRSHDYETLIDVLHHAGLAVLWLDNQGGCKGVCDRVPSVNTSQLKHAELCPGGECLDGILLEGLDARLAAMPAERRARGVVIIMHQMGSHGPAYYKRSPAAFKRFLPECTSNNLQDCSRTELVNAYDNSIAYTDHVLASTIGWLKRQGDYASAMVYVSDHGESLGENNLYLHGMPYSIAPDVQKHVPWVTWLSPAFERRGIATDCLRKQHDAPLSHDHYFHSVLGLLQIKAGIYRRDLDAYTRCSNY